MKGTEISTAPGFPSCPARSSSPSDSSGDQHDRFTEGKRKALKAWGVCSGPTNGMEHGRIGFKPRSNSKTERLFFPRRQELQLRDSADQAPTQGNT